MQTLFLLKMSFQDVWHNFLVQLVTEMSLCPTQCLWVGNQLGKSYQKIPKQVPVYLTTSTHLYIMFHFKFMRFIFEAKDF